MIIKMKLDAKEKDIQYIKKILAEKKMILHEIIEKVSSENNRLFVIIGDISKINIDEIKMLDKIESTIRIDEPFKKVNRKIKKNDTIIDVNGVKIGGEKFVVMAGPCSVESETQILNIAKSIKNLGASILRGGAYKPRTSPYMFQGLKKPGLDFLNNAKKKNNIPIVTEILSTDMIETFVEKVDIIQVGARNMQNFDLLSKLGKTSKPILLKRGYSSTIEEWLMSAEYILNGGNDKVILCERGIRTFEKYTKNTLDLSAVLMAKKLSHLPVIVDPSHSSGKWWMVEKLSLAAAAVGADGLLIEVHNDPKNALCDGEQSLNIKHFEKLMIELKRILPVLGRSL